MQMLLMNKMRQSKTTFTRCQHILKTVKKVPVAKVEQLEQFENAKKLDTNNSLRD